MKIMLTGLLLLVSGFFVNHHVNTTVIRKPMPTVSPTLTASPSATPTPTTIYYPTITPIPTQTDEQYLNDNVTLHTCNGTPVTIPRSQLPQYGHPYNYTPEDNFADSPACKGSTNNSQSQLNEIQDQLQEIQNQQRQIQSQQETYNILHP